MKIIGLIRIRNESEIIQETLDHMAEFCDEIFVYDDASVDNTVYICKSHKKVVHVIEGVTWDLDRERAEYENRQALLTIARQKSYLLSPDDWFIYMDADERIEFDFNKFKEYSNQVDGVIMRLFDFYITEEDKDKHYSERRWIGPEFRDILFLFKNKSANGYYFRDQRECMLTYGSAVVLSGYVKHYGKSISIDQWEKTCDYYSEFFPKYSEKWKKRKGKAIHTESDFGRPLLLWEEKEDVNKIVKLH